VSSPESRIPDSPLLSIEFRDPSVGLEGYLCIHSMGKYGASGGMRCIGDVDKAEVSVLAKTMTYKYAFFNIQQGGAKAGLKVDYDETPERRRELMRHAARHLEPLIRKGIWSAWTDMNFFRDDLSAFYDAIGIAFDPSTEGGSSLRTALSGHASLQAAMEWLRLRPRDARVSIEGFGSVARYLSPFLIEAGVRVVALSNHSGSLYNPRTRPGARAGRLGPR
jgi:glutamate dehydrogenase (NAD(P)+)